MNKFYILMVFCALIFGAFFYGVNITNAKCRMHTAIEQNQNQIHTIKTKGIIHDIVYKTSVGDIRRILFDKYTIKE